MPLQAYEGGKIADRDGDTMNAAMIFCILCGSRFPADSSEDSRYVRCIPCRQRQVTKKVTLCRVCGVRVRRENTSIRSQMCIACYAAALKEDSKRLKALTAEEAKKEEARLVAARAVNSGFTMPNSAVAFGGYPWGHAAANPVM